MDQLGIDHIVIHSGFAALKYAYDDRYWPVAQTPEFVRWTPWQATEGVLVISKNRARPVLLQQIHDSFWEGPAPANDYWNSEVFEIRTFKKWSDIKSDIPKGAYFVGDNLKLSQDLGLEKFNDTTLRSQLEQLRTQKTLYEVACLRMAAIRAAKGHQHLRDVFPQRDWSEFALHFEYLRVTEQADHEQPYGDIVALGSNAAILHHVHYGRKAVSGPTSLLVDAGAGFNGYGSDITRTMVRGTGEAATVFKALIEGVDQLQLQLCSQFKVGIDYPELHNRAHHLIGALLKNLCLIEASPEELVTAGTTRLFFPHGLGHSLGIQVHDVGMKLKQPEQMNAYLRNTATIAHGQVVTVEPGVYFIPSLLQQLKESPMGARANWSLIDQLLPFGGVRIEDDMLATDQGPVNLTRDAVGF
jgi:Xaa-Pro dipeptidase